ncbi:MAG: hypothetical protein RJA36_3696 [Pseudomonadota bacterium]|jgi:hypothetical protein
MVKHQGSVVSTAQAVTATAVSTDSIDLTVGRDLGNGSDIQANFTVLTSATAAGAATVTFEIITADAADLTGNVTVLASSRPYTKEELTVVTTTGNTKSLPITLTIPTNLSARWIGQVIPGVGTVNATIATAGPGQHQPRMRRYLGVRYTVATGPLTGGTFNAWFGPNHVGDAVKHYPVGW